MNNYSEQYYIWLCNKVCNNPRSELNSYNQLMRLLFEKGFYYTLSRDVDRVNDALYMRSIFARDNGIPIEELTHEMSNVQTATRILEIMVALADRCETNIMANHMVGDRTGQWFWEMVSSLGLGQMTDLNFDLAQANKKLTIFLHRRYKPNGEGGLFTVLYTPDDMTKLSIWTQLNLYLNELLVEEGILERRSNG